MYYKIKLRSMLNFEGASLGDFTFSTSWFCENIFTVIAGND